MHGERIPIIEMQGQLLVSVQRELSDVDALALQDDILERLRDTGAHGVILDVTGVEVVDSYIGRVLNDVGHSAASMGADTVLVGLRPAVALTLVDMGVELNRLKAELTLDRALERLRSKQRAPTEGRGTPRLARHARLAPSAEEPSESGDEAKGGLPSRPWGADALAHPSRPVRTRPLAR